MPRPNRDLELFSVYLPAAELAELRALAEQLEAPVADVIRGMIAVGLEAVTAAEAVDEPARVPGVTEPGPDATAGEWKAWRMAQRNAGADRG